jgi:hypothetical protein
MSEPAPEQPVEEVIAFPGGFIMLPPDPSPLPIPGPSQEHQAPPEPQVDVEPV